MPAQDSPARVRLRRLSPSFAKRCRFHHRRTGIASPPPATSFSSFHNSDFPQHHHSGMAAFDCGLFCNAQTPRSYSIAHIQKKIHRNLAEIPAQIWWICKESMNFSCTREAQGALPLDPAKGSSTLWTPFRAIELVTFSGFFRVFIGGTQGALPLDPAREFLP